MTRLEEAKLERRSAGRMVQVDVAFAQARSMQSRSFLRFTIEFFFCCEPRARKEGAALLSDQSVS
jgi:hypothetical protein